ncbi:hypothetical protein GQX74_015228, partial [Glossina fuscipes]
LIDLQLQPKHPIGSSDVPERLKRAYVTASCKKDMLENIKNMFPSLKEEVHISNYVNRFQTHLYLEEMECFVNLRMYDRERAHFTREGKYLALVKENLCERRFLHIVKAKDPWTDNENAERTYEGVIHKALLNRILLKFDANFQQTYNYPDYCLEFYFSHYCYRKQHYANSRAAEKLGDQFLFPTLTQSRERPQLDIKLKDEENLLLRNWQCRWHNCRKNILRGEVLNMPYVVFGPPGTGKTFRKFLN